MMLSQLAFAWLPSDPTAWTFEIVGIVASLLVFASFFWSNEKITRIVNMVGCVIFVIYAVLIQSLSVCIINSACFILHVVKLAQMYYKYKRNRKHASCDEAKAERSQQDKNDDTEQE